MGDIKGWINFYSLAYEAGEIRLLSCTSMTLVHFQRAIDAPFPRPKSRSPITLRRHVHTRRQYIGRK